MSGTLSAIHEDPAADRAVFQRDNNFNGRQLTLVTGDARSVFLEFTHMNNGTQEAVAGVDLAIVKILAQKYNFS